MRWIFRIIGVLAVVAVVAVGAVFLVPSQRIADIAAEQISSASGREVTLSGDVRPTLWPHLGVRAEGLRIGNPDWVSDGPLLVAEAVAIRVPWSAVLTGQIQVEEIALIGPDITLVKAADGRVSWDFGTGEAATTTGPVSGEAEANTPPFALNLAEISRGRLLYRDEVSGQRVEITDLAGQVRLPQSAPATIELDAIVNGAALDLTVAAETIAPLLNGAVTPVALSLSWSGGQADFDGAISTAPAVDGTLTLTATDLGPLAALAGQPSPDLPQGFGRDRVAIEGHVTLATEGTAHLRDAQVVLDGTPYAVALDIIPGEDRPLLRGTLQAEAVTVPSSETASASSGEAGGAGWPTDTIDVSGLFAADAELAVSVQSLDAAGVAVGPVELRATLTRGRLVFDIDRIGAYGGTLAGQFVVNGRGGLSVGGDLLLAGVQLSPLLRDVADYERLTGTGSASLQFLGVGNDLGSIMASLSGQGDFAFGAGAIEGLDIAGMIRNFDTSYRGDGARTVYDSVTANFVVEDGILQNDDLLLDAPWGEVAGAGSVDLGDQTLDYRVIPGVMRDEAGAASIRVPILITGPWSDPTIRPDLEYLAEQEFAEQAARIEAEAQARLDAEADRIEAEARERANELLGLELEEGDTAEDAQEALEQRLQQEVENQLQRLLGEN